MNKKKDAWAWQRQCNDNSGRAITEFEIMEGPERGHKFYKGNAVLRVRQVNPQVPNVPIPDRQIPYEFLFPEGKNLKWCQNHFDEEAQKAGKKLEEKLKKEEEEMQKQMRSRIIAPNKKGGIIGPDGRPMGEG
jgi:hypothetical protein